MRGRRLRRVGFGILVTALATGAWAQVEVSVEELDIGGNPPGLEGMPGVVLHNPDSGTDHLVIFGGCTADWLWDGALVLDSVAGGYDGLTWHQVPVPGMGAACEHVVAGSGDVAYLIGGFKDDFAERRAMNQVLEIRLAGTGGAPVIETTELTVPCTDCPAARVGHAATWLDEFEGCEGGGVLIAGGMNEQWETLDDSWFFCSDTDSGKALATWIPTPYLNLPEKMSDFVILLNPYEISPVIVNKLYLVGYEPGEGLVVYRWIGLGEDGYWKKIHALEIPAGRWGFGATAYRDGIAVAGGATIDGRIVRETWTINLRTFRWQHHVDLPKGVANIFLLGMDNPAAKGVATHAVVFGGVEDFSAPRVLSSSTLLMTFTVPELAGDFAVPAVARVRGSGAFFTSVMHMYNSGATDLELEMTFTPRQGSGGAATTVFHTVPAGVMQTIEDPLQELFGFTGGAGRVGSVLVTVTSGSVADLMVQTVVFARLDSGEEYGQFFPAMSTRDAIRSGETVHLGTTEDPTMNRVNIGLMALADGTRFRITPVGPIGHHLAAPRVFDLDSGGNTQINNLHSTFGLGNMADIVVEVEVLEGSGLAYASVLDGSGSYAGTSDPTTILPTLRGSNRVTLLEIGSIEGLNEFSGSASITNYSTRSASVRADFYQRGQPGVAATANLTLVAGETVGYSDLGADLFAVSGDVGTVQLSSTNGTEIGATGREFAIFRDGQNRVVGTAGQLIAGQTDADLLEPGTVYHFIGLRQERGSSGVERSHFAVFNPATTDAEVTVRLFDGATGMLEGQRSWIVGTRTLSQVNNVIRAINPDHDGNEKRIEVEVNRRVFMNAFRVNRWGDPVTLSPFGG